jgi:hypothetical protein
LKKGRENLKKHSTANRPAHHHYLKDVHFTVAYHQTITSPNDTITINYQAKLSDKNFSTSNEKFP